MPICKAGDSEVGWGCTCPSFRFGEPKPDAALKALAKAAVVTVEDMGTDGPYRRYRAWTEPGKYYEVARGPGRGGFCKHVAACLFLENPWLRQAALGASDLLEQFDALEKENKKLRREIARWQKASKK